MRDRRKGSDDAGDAAADPTPEVPEAAEVSEVAEAAEVAEVAEVKERRTRLDMRAARDGLGTFDLGRLPENRFALAGLVLVALAALFGAATFSRPSVAAPRTGRGAVPITTAAMVCPDPSGSRVGVLTPPEHGAGQVRITDAGGASMATVNQPGTAWSTEVKKANGAWTLRAHGAIAAGLTAEQTTADHGLAGVRCAEPVTDSWFLGPGPGDAQDIDLYITDIDAQPVTVDVEAITAAGPVNTSEGRGLTVGPYSTMLIHVGRDVVGLRQALSGANLLGLHVVAVNGRVATSVRVRRAGGGGVDWLPVIAAPANDLVVPGLPSGAGDRRLLIAAPGDTDATVTVQALTGNGAFVPPNLAGMLVPAGTVVPVDLGLGGAAAGLKLTANTPIVAAILVSRGTGDFAAGAAAAPMTPGGPAPPPSGAGTPPRPRPQPGRQGRQARHGRPAAQTVQASVVALPTGSGVADVRATSTLLLTAPETAAVVRLTPVTATTAGTASVVRVPAGRTVEVPLQSAVLVMPSPGSGPVYGARFLEVKGAGITLLPLMPDPTAVPIGPAVDSATVAYSSGES